MKRALMITIAMLMSIGLCIAANWTQGSMPVGLGYSSPVQKDSNTVAIGEIDGNVYFLSSTSGSVITSIQTSGSIYSNLLIDGTMVYVGSTDGNLYAIDTANNNAMLWKFNAGNNINGAPYLAFVNGLKTLFFSSNDGKMYSLNTVTGTSNWIADLGSGSRGTPVFASGKIFTGTAEGNVFALDVSSGAQLWEYYAQAPIAGSVIADNNSNSLFFATAGGRVIALDTTSLSVVSKWVYPGSGSIGAVYTAPALATAAGTIFVASSDKNVYGIDSTTGLVKWNYSTSDVVYGSPVVFYNYVVFGCRDGNIYALDTTQSSIVRWSASVGTGSGIEASPTVSNGSVLIKTTSGSIIKYEGVLPYDTNPPVTTVVENMRAEGVGAALGGSTCVSSSGVYSNANGISLDSGWAQRNDGFTAVPAESNESYTNITVYPSNGELHFYRSLFAYNYIPGNQCTYEFRIKVLDALCPICIGGMGGSAQIMVFPNFVAVPGGPSVMVSPGTYHNIRVTMQMGMYSVYVDGVVLAQYKFLDSWDPGQVIVGYLTQASGDFMLDYFKSTSGCYEGTTQPPQGQGPYAVQGTVIDKFSLPAIPASTGQFVAQQSTDGGTVSYLAQYSIDGINFGTNANMFTDGNWQAILPNATVPAAKVFMLQATLASGTGTPVVSSAGFSFTRNFALNNDDVYIGSKVVLSATDLESGVDHSEYKLYPQGSNEPGTGTVYSQPFDISDTALLWNLNYQSFDKAGNQETEKLLALKKVNVKTGASQVYTNTVGAVPLSLTFSSITGSGITQSVETTSYQALPWNYTLNGSVINISTTAGISGPISISLGKTGLTTNSKLLHYESGSWNDITSSVDLTRNQISGTASSLSLFAVADAYYPTITASIGSLSKCGSISPSGAVVAAANGSKTFTISTGTGYVVHDVLVDGVSVGAVSSYTFTNLTTDHSIVATFLPAGDVVSASFIKEDTTTQGTWKENYGSDGYKIAGDTQSLPSYVTMNLGSAIEEVKSSSVTDIRAIQTGSSNTRIAADWCASSAPNKITIDMNITDGQAHQVSVYLLDWLSAGRVEEVDVNDIDSNTLLYSKTIYGFNNGEYLAWNIKGHVNITVTCFGDPQNTNGQAVASALFFGGAYSTVVASSVSNSTFGTITPSGSIIVPAASTQAFTITPSTGYAIMDVLLDDVSVGAVSTYSLTNVSADHTIKASFQTAPPVVSGVTPATFNNKTASTLTITGSGFYGMTSSSNVTSVRCDSGLFSYASSSYSVTSDTKIVSAIVPIGMKAGTYDVKVANTGGANQTSAVKLVVTTDLPTVANVSPTTGNHAFLTTVTITGTKFFGGASTPDVYAVKLSDTFNTQLTSVSVVSDSIINAVIPSGVYVGSYSIRVTNGGGSNTTSTVKFTVLKPVPLLSGISVNSGNNNSPFTLNINGNYFFGGTASCTVTGITIKASPAAAVSFTAANVSNTCITNAVIPTGCKTGTYDIVVTTAGGTTVTSANSKFSVTTLPPVISSINPSVVDGTEPATVSIVGTGFFGGSTTPDVTNLVLETAPGITPIYLGNAVYSATLIQNVIVPGRIDPGQYNFRISTSGGANTITAMLNVGGASITNTAQSLGTSNEYFMYSGSWLEIGPTGYSSLRKVFNLKNGTIAAFFDMGTWTVLRMSLDNGRTFGAAINICYSEPFFSAWKDASDNIYLCYRYSCVNFRKLTYVPSTNSYTVGAQTIVDNAAANFSSSIARETNSNRIWVVYMVYDYLSIPWSNVKYSDDEGATWSGLSVFNQGPSTNLSSQDMIICQDGYPAVIFRTYSDLRFIKWNGSTWDPSIVIPGLFPSATGNFSALVDSTGVVHVVAATSSGIMHSKRSAAGVWDASPFKITFNAADSNPSLSLVNGTLYCFYTAYSDARCDFDVAYMTWVSGTNWTKQKWYYRQAGKAFSTVLAASGSVFADVTKQAISYTSADVSHPATSSLLKNVGDQIYFGSTDKFSTIYFILSTAGAGGVVTWSYSDGAGNWISTTPGDMSNSSAVNFASSSMYWFFTGAAPSNWGMQTVNGVSNYWIRATVTTAYTTSPIGSQFLINERGAGGLTSSMDIGSGSPVVPIFWSEWNGTMNTKWEARAMVGTLYSAPVVAGVSPVSGVNSLPTTVTITGNGFFGTAGTASLDSLRLDNATGTDLNYASAVISDTSIRGAVIPPGIQTGTYGIKVKVKGVENTLVPAKFSVTGPVPVVSSVTPSTGLNTAAVTVTITGTSFFGGSLSADVSIIRLDTVPETPVFYSSAVISDTCISGAVIPASIKAGSYNVKVTTSAGVNITSVMLFTVTAAAPTITSITPATVSISTSTVVTIKGTGFLGGTSTSDVRRIYLSTSPETNLVFSGAVVSDSAIIGAIVPAGISLAGTYPVQVVTGGGSSNTLSVNVVAAAPAVTSALPSPVSNSSAATLTINGFGFNNGTAAFAVTDVRLDDPSGTPFNISSAGQSNTTIVGALLPSGIKAGSYNVKVTTPSGVNSVSDNKLVITGPIPAVSSFDPGTSINTAPVTLSISGSGFFGGTTASDVLSIKIASNPDTYLSEYSVLSDTIIIGAVLPTGTKGGSYALVVKTSAGYGFSASNYVVTANPPIVSSVSPGTRSSLTPIELSISGSGFFGGTNQADVRTITLDTVPETPFDISNMGVMDGLITGVLVPRGVNAGTYNVKVTTGGGTNITSSGKYRVNNLGCE